MVYVASDPVRGRVYFSPQSGAMYNNQLTDGVREKVLDNLLPKPRGYKLLIAIAKINEKKGSILLPDQYKALEDTASILGNVIDMGDDAYFDQSKFPTGPHCKKGDWVMFRSYSGTRFKVGDQEFRLINDDQVDAVVLRPDVIERV